MTVISRDTHREMMLSPYKWPLFYLPLKRRNPEGGFPQLAILRTATNKADENFNVDVNLTLFGPVGEVEHLTYSGVDAILDDGWEVD